MLRETAREWTQQWKREGHEEGYRAGRRDGEATLLIRQLEFKFGPLQPGDRARIDAADSEQLFAWGERVLTARSLDEVLEVSVSASCIDAKGDGTTTCLS